MLNVYRFYRLNGHSIWVSVTQAYHSLFHPY